MSTASGPASTDTDLVIGLVQPFDSALDHEYWSYLPDGATLLIARTPHVQGALTADLILRTSDSSLVLPVVADMAAALDPPVIAYSCTSGSFLRGLAGERRMREEMLAAGAQQAVTTSSALLDAFAALSVSRVAVATPYDDEMTDGLIAFLSEGGLECVSAQNLGLSTDPADVAADEVIALARRADHPDAEALFISCTNLRTREHIATIEDEIGKPVVTSNQVVMWAALRAIGSKVMTPHQRLFQVFG